MTLHLVKLCVGCDSIEDLAAWQKKRLADQRKRGAAKPQLIHTTRNAPKRGDEIAGEGSLYWVIKGAIRCRQKIVGFRSGKDRDGEPYCHILLASKLVRVRPKPMRAFQGWRYFEAADAPPDLDAAEAARTADMPPAMVEELRALGLV